MMVEDELAVMNPENEDSDPETESEEEGDEEEDQQVVKLAEPSKTAVYNREGLLERLGDISWPDNLDWSHRLNIDREEQEVVDVNDDLAREHSFFTQALDGARQMYLSFQSKGEPFLRPADYYAEMVKTDTHMEKVKGRLLAEKRKMEESEERRKARENKKLAKEVQAQKMKDRAKQKKQEIESVKKWRKQRQQSGFDKEGAAGLDLPFDEDGTKPFQRSNKKRPGVSPGDRSGGKAAFGGKTFGGKGKGPDKKRKSREFRDSKFGFGGRKGLKKQNTAETTNDFKGFQKGEVSAKNKRAKR
ncbi:probable rRNA-processing protein EBP2 homolog [Nicotiana tomentosiformis]|uniref:probable rRNA-processing protein EBP2 homolog n=1 Tax=Nicotiana tomentosiformis TaxID=4098 RepID=UPI00051AE581|nr:probable rRNA-processing protein EBP2 homolog [Nicotiana tomentosiformis]